MIKLNELEEAWELIAREYRNYVLLALLRDLGWSELERRSERFGG